MVDQRIRDELLRDIRALSEKLPVAYLELIQPHHGKGAVKSSIVANAYDVFLERNLPVTWPVAEIRELWMRSVNLIPDATVRDGEPDAGFKEWLWLQTQRRWTARHEIGYAINPFMMWHSALVTVTVHTLARSDGGFWWAKWAVMAGVRKSNVFFSRGRQVSRTVSRVSTKRLPESLGVPKLSCFQRS